jgi:hypothetical protein
MEGTAGFFMVSLPISLDINVWLRRLRRGSPRRRPSAAGADWGELNAPGANVGARWTSLIPAVQQSRPVGEPTNPPLSRKTDIASNLLCSNVALSNFRTVA